MMKHIFSCFSMVVAIAIIVLGVIGWKQQRIFMVVDKNKINIENENLREFTGSMGKAYIILGIAMIVSFTIDLSNNENYCITALVISILLCIIDMLKSIMIQKKYKVGRWSK